MSALAGVGGVGMAQSAEIELDAQVSGWVGRSPPEIAGETNPTLTLEPGQTYRVAWTNADGVPHNFAITDGDGNRPVSSEIVEQEGASQTVEFDVTPAMAEYLCEVHPQTMRGQLSLGTGGTSGADETATTEDGEGEQTEEGTDDEETEDSQPPVLESTTIVLGALTPYWLGLAPEGIQGQTNPTLRLREGAEYELVWINLDGVEHDFHLIDGAGKDLADTSSREDAGDTHETSFEATLEMAEYYCEYHPQSMRGAVEIS